jgi:hypothetical protein
MRMRQTTGIGRAVAVGVFALGVALVPSLAGAQGDEGQQGDQGQGSQASASQTTNATLKVTKIDKANHMITFEDPRGGTFDVKAGPDVNLDKVHAGQMLDVTYYEEVAVSVSKPGQAVPMARQTSTNRGGVTAKQMTITAQIISVDKENNTVRVKDPTNGQLHTLAVTDPSIQQRLSSVQPGDNLTISYTQAVAVAAQPHQT